MPLDLSRAGHDPGDPAPEPMLADLQGNILKSYGRNGTVLLLIRFLGNDPAAARRWIQGFARAFVTTARIQEQQSAAFKWSRQPTLGGLFANVFLTARGYLALGIPDEQVPRDLQAFFNRGMPVRQGALRDPKIESWQAEFQRAIDAMASLASDDLAELHRHAAAVQAELSGIAAEVWAETGSRVYRKLEQNVIGFDRAIEALARTIKATPELAGAYAVGRFKDGTPVVVKDRPSAANPPANNFNYSGDPHACRCPFHAHTRKTNPRGDTSTLLTPGVPLEEERGHRIVRRSINFGRPEDVGKSPVGIHFLCFQADLGLQFEFIQTVWSSAVGFIKPETGTDPVIGQGNNLPQGQEWPHRWGDPGAGSTRVSMTDFVTLKGGEYFFAPSVGFLKNLGAGA